MKKQFRTNTGQITAISSAAFILAVLVVVTAAVAQSSVGNSAQIKIKWVPITYVAPDNGPQMYAQYCASCHGATGRGDGVAAPGLSKPPSDLSTLTARNNGRFPESRVYLALSKFTNNPAASVQKEGKETMPCWHDAFRSLSDEALRIENLLQEIKKFQVAEASALNTGVKQQ